MTLFPTESLVPTKMIDAEIFTGSFPPWIVEKNEGGTTNAYDASHDGGYWELVPGSEKLGDEAKLVTTFALSPTAYDVIELSTRVRTTSLDARALEFVLGFESETNDSILYSYQNTCEDFDDHLRIQGNGSDSSYTARKIDDVLEHEIVIRWFTTENRAELYTDQILAGLVDEVGIDQSQSYTPMWSATYQGGDDAALRIHAATLRYFTQSNPEIGTGAAVDQS